MGGHRFATIVALSLLVPVLGGVADAVADPLAKFDPHLRGALAGAADSVPVIALTVGDPGPAAEHARSLGADVTWEYRIIDGFAARVPVHALPALAVRADVTGVYLDREVEPVMDVSSQAIEADRMWAYGYDGSGITVAVIDTGIEFFHPFFAGAIVSCVSTIGGLVSPECTDSDGHGTHVAGTVASRDDRWPGIAPGASLAAVRVLHALGAGLTSDVIAGMQWVQENQNNVNPPIRVATMSIGSVGVSCGNGTDPSALAADSLVASGVTFTVSAGNDGHDSCTVDGAASAFDVITVGAVDDRGTVTQSDDVIAGFSSGGPTTDGRIKPDIVYPGVRITSAFIGGGVFIATMSGTSMATPHAAGVAALMLQQDPTLTPAELKDTMLAEAVTNDHTGTTPNNVYGHGLGNACTSLGFRECGDDAPRPRIVHVTGLTLTAQHFGSDGHRLLATATVVDSSGAAVRGATVHFELVHPDGSAFTGRDRTDALGLAAYAARDATGGHGEWTACVTDVAGREMRYNEGANDATCVDLVVAH